MSRLFRKGNDSGGNMMPKIGELAEIRKGKSTRESPTGKYRLVLISSIDREGNLDLSKLRKIDSYQDIQRNVLQADDIVLSVDGTTDKFALVPKGEKKLVVGGTCVRLRCKNRDEAKRIYEYFTSEEGQEELAKRRKGVIIKHITINELREMEIE